MTTLFCFWTTLFFSLYGVAQTKKKNPIEKWNENVEDIFHGHDLGTVNGIAETRNGDLWCVGLTEDGIYWVKINKNTEEIVNRVFTKKIDREASIHSFKAIGNDTYAILGNTGKGTAQKGWLLIFDENGQITIEKHGISGTAFFDFVTMETGSLLISGRQKNKMALFALEGQNLKTLVCEHCVNYSEGRGIARNLADEIFITGYEKAKKTDETERAKTPTLKVWKYIGHLNIGAASLLQEVTSIEGAEGISIVSTYGENCLLDYSFGVLAKSADSNDCSLLRINPVHQTVDVDTLAEFESLNVPTRHAFLMGGYYDSIEGSQNLQYWIGGYSNSYHRFAGRERCQLYEVSAKVKDNKLFDKVSTDSKIGKKKVSCLYQLRDGELIIGGTNEQLGYLHKQKTKHQQGGQDCQMMLAFSKKNKGTVLYAGSEEMRTARDEIFITPKIISKNPLQKLTIRFDKNDNRGYQPIYDSLLICKNKGEGTRFGVKTTTKGMELSIKNGLYYYEYGTTLQLNIGINQLNFITTNCTGGEIPNYAEDYQLNYLPIDFFLWSMGVPSDLTYTVADAKELYRIYEESNQKQYFKSGQINCSIDSINTTALKIEEIFADKAVNAKNDKNVGVDKNDLMIFYISSHAHEEERDLILHPSNYHEIIETAQIHLKKNVLPHLEKIPCKKLLLIDACQSGAAFGKDEDGWFVEDKSLIVISAAEEGAFEGKDWNNSAFMMAMLEAFNSKITKAGTGDCSTDEDYNQKKEQEKKFKKYYEDGFLSVKELYDYLSLRVPFLVRQRCKGEQQIPKLILPKGVKATDSDWDFPIFYRSK